MALPEGVSVPQWALERRTIQNPRIRSLLGCVRNLESVLASFEGKGFADFKRALTDLAVAELGPVGAEMRRLTDDPGTIDAILRDGAERATALAEPILAEVYDVVGFLRP